MWPRKGVVACSVAVVSIAAIALIFRNTAFSNANVNQGNVGNAQAEMELTANEAQSAELISDLKAKYSSWMPEKLLKLQYDCSYDATIYDGKGAIQRSFHAEHPYTRGISLDFLPEWLIYGGGEPAAIIETDKYHILEYRTWLFLPYWTYMPTDLSWSHGTPIDPDIDRQYDSMKKYYLEEVPSLMKRYTDARVVCIWVDKANGLIAFADYIPQYNMLNGVVRYRFNYDNNDRIMSIARLFYEQSSVDDRKAANEHSAYFEKNPPEDSMFSANKTKYTFGFSGTVGYISEVSYAYEGGAQLLVQIKNFSIKPAQEADVQNADLLKRMKGDAYRFDEPRY